MKHFSIIVIVTIFVMACNHSAKYQDEDLLFKYIDSYVSIDDKEYYLFFIRNQIVCKGCIYPSDTFIEKVVNRKEVTPLFLIIDDAIEAKRIDSVFNINHRFTIRTDSRENLHPYGLHQVHPHLFHIKNNRLLNWERFQ